MSGASEIFKLQAFLIHQVILYRCYINKYSIVIIIHINYIIVVVVVAFVVAAAAVVVVNSASVM